MINIVKEGEFYVARCPTLDVTSQGKTLEEAQENIKEAIEAWLGAFGADSVEENAVTTSPYWTIVAV